MWPTGDASTITARTVSVGSARRSRWAYLTTPVASKTFQRFWLGIGGCHCNGSRAPRSAAFAAHHIHTIAFSAESRTSVADRQSCERRVASAAKRNGHGRRDRASSTFRPASTGLALHASHSATHSNKSTRRWADSILLTTLSGRFNRAANFRCVRPASVRIARMATATLRCPSL
jgi:hypothetical protein